MSVPKTMGTIIKELRIDKGMSQTDLAAAMGYRDRTTVAKIESGENKLPDSKVAKMAGILGVTPEYLRNTLENNLYSLDIDIIYHDDKVELKDSQQLKSLFLPSDYWEELKQNNAYRFVWDKLGVARPEGRFTSDTVDVVPATKLPAKNLNFMPPTHKVPRLGPIACGAPILAEENIQGYDDIPGWIKCDFTLTCQGDSMINARIFDGDVVCIHRQPDVENGEIAAVMVDDDTATLKRVRKFDDHIVLEPENPNYRPQTFWDADMARVRILGKATHFISTIR